ncbi:tetratricopeptide repeat protein [Streptomyces sp. NPDC005921]|uniref:tetratricopeptide repeat protein n=1 Tax=Streptomyces sp. NPDC005827 TaxID=3157070 RepID=UPI0033DFA983
MSGHRGPAPGTRRGPVASVHLSASGDATAASGGLANTGYIAALTLQQRGPQEPASWPHQVGVIPPVTRSFLHRTEAHLLRAKIDSGGTAVLTQLLTGMGGVGKTQLAADYARTAWNDPSAIGGLDVLVWTTASSRQAIVNGYAQAGVELCRADPDDAETAARTFLAWLSPKATARTCRWLIVLDDVADPADLIGLWPPDSPHGRTLVTTRRRDAALTGLGHHTVEVGLFTEGDALTYLTKCLTGHGRDGESADRLTVLAADLGHLPLALSQAAAYLIDSGETVADYRHRLADRSTPLTDTTPGALPDGQALPLAAAWSLSIDRADALHPAGLARPMLHLTSLLDANGIPDTVLTSEPVLAHLTTHRSCPAPASVSRRDAVHALRALYRLSLIGHTPRTPHQAVRVHQLIQRTTRDALTPHQHDQAVRTVADALVCAWPSVERDTGLTQALRANAQALTACAEDALHRPNAHAVLYRLGTSLGEAGQVAAARDHYRHLADTNTRRLGPDHPDTVTALGNLARWRGEAGDAAVAADTFAHLLERTVRVLGKDHPDTLTTRHSLARWRGRAGDAASAAAGLAELLPDQLRVLGPDHPDTLTTRGYLAFWRGRTGDAAGAVAGLADLLPDQERILGPDHPDALVTRGNLAQWRGRAGDAATAAADLAELLERKEKVLGLEHPHTLATRKMLSHWRTQAEQRQGVKEA